MKIAIIGTGIVGQTFAAKFIALGHEVMIGTRDVAEKLSESTPDVYGNPPFGEWHKTNSSAKLGTFAEVATFGEVLLNATKGANSIEALTLANIKNHIGKILIDVTNPLDFSKGIPPSLLPGLSNTNSLGEEIQETFPQTKVVKTLNTMWCGLMVNPNMIGGADHVNFICGNDSEAKTRVKMLLTEFGWKHENVIDLGDISGARATEAILLIWLRIWAVKQTGAFNFKIVS